MSSKLKMYLARKLIEALPNTVDLSPKYLNSLIQLSHSQQKNNIEMNLPLNSLEKHIGIPNLNLMLKIEPDDIVRHIQYEKTRADRMIKFEINRNMFVKDVVEQPVLLAVKKKPRKIVVDFSSPNIAKPFHMGHLRSTIIGNFIANLFKFNHDHVVKLNYLGDWGTQFGLIQVGVEKLNYTPELIKEKPIERLYESYVLANKLASTDPSVKKLAREQFLKLEKGEYDGKQQWQSYVSFTIDELKNTYGRLGITFDEYAYESMYMAKEIKGVIDIMRNKNVLKTDVDGKKYALVNNRRVTLMKSDGTTLYLMRDVAAAMDRFEKHKFDNMYYVVENGQNEHFNALKYILHSMDLPWTDRLKHVKFGRIHGMSTRKGTVVFLKDILDEMKELMILKQIQSPTTKASISDGETSDILGVSCVIVNDLKQRRQRDYQFDWNKVLQADGDTGIKLQYTHCRLCNLEKNCGIIPAGICNPELVDQLEVTNVVREIGRFHDVLHKSEEQLEACVLVKFLFNLCNAINRAFKVLRVKDEDPVIASQRLLVFLKAREVLKQGMIILGLKPLEQM